MKRRHFEQLRPVCPVCRETTPDGPSPVQIAFVEEKSANDVLAGGLVCTNEVCRCEFPIIDGIPFLVPRVREFVTAQAWSIHERRDLPPGVASILGDCGGPESPFETNRRQVGSYAADHYADRLDLGTSSVVGLLETLIAGIERPLSGPRIDLGCSVGRTTFELATSAGDDLVLGIDANVAMLRVARELLCTGRTSVPLRRVGVVHDERTIEATFANAEAVDFWACDTHALPFEAGTVGAAVGLNVLDCVASPTALLGEIGRVLRDDGLALTASPYDWATSATPFEGWLGGHSQRSEFAGDSVAVLRSLLSGDESTLRIVREFDRLPWRVRVHDRSTMHYDVHGMILERANAV